MAGLVLLARRLWFEDDPDSLLSFVLLVIAVVGAVAGWRLVLRERFSRFWNGVAAVIGVVSAIYGVIVTLSVREPEAADPDCRQMETGVALERGPDAEATEASMTEVSYAVTNGMDMTLGLAGHVDGRPDEANQLRLVRRTQRADDSRDSTDPPVQGTGNVYLYPEVTLDRDGCWYHEPEDVGYRCSAGLDFEFFLALMPDAEAERLEALRAENREWRIHGFPSDELLDNEQIKLLEHFEVPTDQSSECPGFGK